MSDLKLRTPFAGMARLTFRFGEAPDWYVKIAGYPHNGVDFGMGIGTPILATDAGVVNFADNVPDADGLGIIISHSWGSSLYWHLSELRARRGDVVKRSDVIGLSGDTGWCTGPHLHFGMKVNGVSVPGMRGWADPELFLADDQDPDPEPVIVGRYHIVKLGETLWSIAVKYYGKGFYWDRIYKANSDRIKYPSLIYPFQKLLIP